MPKLPEFNTKPIKGIEEEDWNKFTIQRLGASERMKNGKVREAAMTPEAREKQRRTMKAKTKGQGNERLSTPEVRAKAHVTRKANNNYDTSHLHTPEVREKARIKMKKTKKGKAPAHNFDRQWQEKKYRRVNQLTMNGEFIKTWDGIAEAAAALGIKRPGITSVCSDKPQYTYCKSYKGFKWEYTD